MVFTPLRFPRLRGTETSGAREKTALLSARNRFAIRLAGHQSPAPCCAGWDRLPIILLKVLDTTPILEPPCLVISHKENVMSLMYKDESSSHHKLSSYPYPRKTYHNDHLDLL